MKQITLGSTHICVLQNAFGALPIQRVDLQTATEILQRYYDGGMRFYDTARAYSDSEEKIGHALSGVREHIYIATKTQAHTADAFWNDLKTLCVCCKRRMSIFISSIARIPVFLPTTAAACMNVCNRQSRQDSFVISA